MQIPVYLDNNATTPLDQRVVDAMMPFFTDKFGNVSSRHAFGHAVKGACEEARQSVASILGARSSEIIFTSGATESINLALKGVAHACKDRGRHIVTTQIEHKAVLDSCAFLEEEGFEVTYVAPDSNGFVSEASIVSAIRTGDVGTKQRTILLSVMGANNEIGTINPIKDIIKAAKTAGVLIHVDAAQAIGKIPFTAASWGADLVSVSAHKIYGPKGIGALFVSDSSPQLKLCPQIHGGGQELGLRSGTLPVPLIVGLGVACDLALSSLNDEMARLNGLRQRLWQGIKAAIPDAQLNGHPVHRLPGNLHVTVPSIDGELIAVGMRDVAVSSTSACSATTAQPSHVLMAIGKTKQEAGSSIRFGIGRFNTEEEIDFAIAKLADTMRRFGKKKIVTPQIDRVFSRSETSL